MDHEWLIMSSFRPMFLFFRIECHYTCDRRALLVRTLVCFCCPFDIILPISPGTAYVLLNAYKLCCAGVHQGLHLLVRAAHYGY